MRVRKCLPPCLRLCIVLAAAWGGLCQLSADELIPLAVRGGRCEAVLPTEQGDTFYLILGALSYAPGPHRVTVHTETTRAPVAVPRAPVVHDPQRPVAQKSADIRFVSPDGAFAFISHIPIR